VIVVLDASAAIKIVFQQTSAKQFSQIITNADWVITPDIYVSEVTNVFWKYHQLEDLPLDITEDLLNKAIRLIDDVIEAGDLYQEAFNLSCQTNHPVYDSLYLICARRYSATLVSVDNKLNKLAQKHSIRTVDRS
jgi:predicted nucleic acid-binding protein